MMTNFSEDSGCFVIHTIMPMVPRTSAVASKVHILETVRGIETVKLVKRLHGLQERTATFRRKFLNALGVQAVRFKTILVDKELSLRICRLWDLPQLKTRLVPGLFLQACCFRLKSEAAGHRRLTLYEDSPGLRRK
jgi:hypothetical protein